ncbi:MAG: LCP family protein [Nocardioidaceae bacterium]|nr:LCP family protein [Nocardioidaceae bacterium]
MLGVPPPAPAPPSPPAPQQSFGGTYNPPDRQAPRFATPVAPAPYGGYGPPQPPSPQGSSPHQARAPRRRRKNWWLRGILALLFAWVVFLVAVPIWAWSQIAQVDAEPDGDRPPETPGTTYLLVGSDSREGLTKEEEADLGTGDAAGGRTDTILLLHVPDSDGPKLLLSIPRDSLVDVPGRGEQKINAAYAFGGADLLVETVEQATDVRVDNYLEVGFAGFVDMVDAIGGIEVCPTEAIDDPKAGGLKLDKGCSEVDGRTALGYSRSRAFERGDITRALHQREVITAVGERGASWQTVVLPWRYFQVNAAAEEALRVGEDVGPIDVAGFAWAMAHPGKDAKRCVVPYTSLGQATSVGSAVIWDDERAGAIFTAIRQDDTGSISCKAQ